MKSCRLPKVRYRLRVCEDDTAQAYISKERLHRRIGRYYMVWRSESFGFAQAFEMIHRLSISCRIPKEYLWQFCTQDFFDWDAIHDIETMLQEMRLGLRPSEPFSVVSFMRMREGIPMTFAFVCPRLAWRSALHGQRSLFHFQPQVFPQA